MVSLLRKPEAVYGATDASDFRWEENLTNDVKYDYVVGENSAKVIVYPSGSPVKYLKLRFRGNLENVDKVMGDQWERVGLNAYLEFRSILPCRVMPWFTYVIEDGQMSCYGVKTGADAFVFFQVDPDGITMFINLCNATNGTDLQEALVACEVVERFAQKGEDYYKTAQAFAKQMCDNPVLPKTPIFGVNNWYWAYGNVSYDIVCEEVDQLMKLAEGCKNAPYAIIDDGWQWGRDDLVKSAGMNPGGPWEGNSRFPDMKKMTDAIHERGAKAGLWFRPLLTQEQVPAEMMLGVDGKGSNILDPTHPEVLKKVEETARKFTKEWGFDLIKRDFSTIDATGVVNMSGDKDDYLLCTEDRKFYDNTKTLAMILKDLYKAIQKGAGDAEVIACNTVSHLTAGIHSTYRIGNDTSGRCFEWTRRDGVNSLMRLPLNNVFYNADPDCAPFTTRVPFQANLDFLELCALTSMTTLASIKPGLLTEEQMKQVNAVFRMADENKGDFGIANFDKNSCPEKFVSADGKTEKRFNWNEVYDGSRMALTWFD